mgnify:FL=1
MIKYPFLVGLRTARPVERIESWLAAYCAGRWHVRLDEIAPDLSHKNLVIAFEKAEDRTAFKNAFAKSGAAQQQAHPGADNAAAQDTAAA